MAKLTQQVNSLEPKEKGETSRSAYQRRKATPGDICFKCNRKGHFLATVSIPRRRKGRGRETGNDQQLTQRPEGKLIEQQCKKAPVSTALESLGEENSDNHVPLPHATYKARTVLFVQAVTRGVKANLLADTGATDSVLSSEL